MKRGFRTYFIIIFAYLFIIFSICENFSFLIITVYEIQSNRRIDSESLIIKSHFSFFLRKKRIFISFSLHLYTAERVYMPGIKDKRWCQIWTKYGERQERSVGGALRRSTVAKSYNTATVTYFFWVFFYLLLTFF